MVTIGCWFCYRFVVLLLGAGSGGKFVSRLPVEVVAVLEGFVKEEYEV